MRTKRLKPQTLRIAPSLERTDAFVVVLSIFVGVAAARIQLLAGGLVGCVLLLGLVTLKRPRKDDNAPAVTSSRSEQQRLPAALTWGLRSFPMVAGLATFNERLGLAAAGALLLALLPFTITDRVSQLVPARVLFLALTAEALWLYQLTILVQTLCGAVVIALVLLLWRYRVPVAKSAVLIFDGIAIYLAISVVAYYVLGLRSPTEANRLSGFESSFGVTSLRIFLPFTSSLVYPSVLASAHLVWQVPRVARGRSRGRWEWGAVVLAVFVILAANYRVPALTAMFVLLALFFAPRVFAAAALPLAMVALLVPLWWNGGRNPVFVVVDEITHISTFNRDPSARSADARTLQNRTELWDAARDAFDQSARFTKLVGYGLNGQVKSGASSRFAAVTKGFARAGRVSAHSTVMQSLLDTGLIGTMILLSTVAVGLRVAKREIALDHACLEGGLLPTFFILAVSGATEVTLCLGTNSIVAWMFLLFTGSTLAPLLNADAAFAATSESMHGARG